MFQDYCVEWRGYSFTSNPLLVQSNRSLESLSFLSGYVKLGWRGGLHLRVFTALVEDLSLIPRHPHDGSQSSVTLFLADSTLYFAFLRHQEQVQWHTSRQNIKII